MRNDILTRAESLFILLGALTVTMFVLVVPPTPFEALDFRSILLPYLTYYRDSLAAGEFPFWNPDASLGRPFAADPQAIVFWPATVFYLVFDPFWGALILTWLHVALAAWWSTRLCLRLAGTGADTPAARGPALFSGFVFVLSGKIIGHFQAGHMQFVFSYLYLPCLWYAAVRVQEEGDRRSFAWLAAVSGWQLLAGAPQVYWNCAVAVALLLAGRRCLGSPENFLRRLAGDTWRVACAYALGLCLTGILLVPVIELIGQSNRSGLRPDYTALGSMDWPQWLSLLTPRVRPDYIVDWEMLLYPGALVVVLGVAGLARWRDSNVRGLGAVLIGGGILAAGSHTPLYSWLLHGLPGYASFHVHGRTGSVLVYALVVSATLLLMEPGGFSRRWRSVVAVGAACLTIIVALAWSVPVDSFPIWLVRPVGLFVAATAAGALWFVWSTGRKRLAAGGALCLLTGFDLFTDALLLKRTFITAKDYSAESALVAALNEHRYLQPGQPPPRVFAPPDLVRANAGMLYGFSTLAGSEALALSRVWSYVHWAVGREPPTFSDIYAFNYLIEKGPFPVPWTAQVAGLDAKAGRIELLAASPPRAWLNGTVRVVSGGWPEAAGRLAAGHDARREALLETPLPPEFMPHAAGARGQAHILEFHRNRILLEVTAPDRALLVLAETWHPGWRARIDGRELPVVPVNGWMRGIPVPAGTSRIELRYLPNHFFAGALLSALSCTLCLWLMRPVHTRSFNAAGSAA